MRLRNKKTEIECSCASKRLKMNARATSWVAHGDEIYLVRQHNLEPIMRVAFSKSGTSQVTNSRFHGECAEEQCMCKPH